MKTIGYIIGALKNPEIPIIATQLRSVGYEIVDDWYAAGPEADEIWREYEQARGRPFCEAIKGIHAKAAFESDKEWLDKADFVVLVLPAGKSGHLELGYAIGKGKPAWVLMPEPPMRFDLMYRFATGIVATVDELTKNVNEWFAPHRNISTAIPQRCVRWGGNGQDVFQCDKIQGHDGEHHMVLYLPQLTETWIPCT